MERTDNIKGTVNGGQFFENLRQLRLAWTGQTLVATPITSGGSLISLFVSLFTRTHPAHCDVATELAAGASGNYKQK